MLKDLFSPVDDNLLIMGEFHPAMVVLSLAIAVFASFMALQVASQASCTKAVMKRHALIFSGSVALGGGVWSMHFIGMLAFTLCTPVTYDWGLTSLSFLPSVAASWVALNVITKEKPSPMQLITGGVLVGAGIGTMHYVGMAAMQMAPLLRYDLLFFALSIVVAVLLAILALWVRFSLNNLGRIILSEMHKNALAALVMGLAVSGMHYIGMAAARFVRPAGFEFSTQSDSMSYYLAFAVTFITVGIINLVLAINLVVKHKDSSRNAKLSEARYRATISTSLNGILTFDNNGQIEHANQAMLTLVGRDLSELRNLNVRSLVPQRYLTAFDDFLTSYKIPNQGQHKSSGRDAEIVHKNGHLIPVHTSIGHVELEGQSYFVVFVADLRQRMEMEQALRHSEAQLRSLIANIPGIAYRCLNTDKWPMVFVSDAVQSITGYPAEDYLYPHQKRNFFEHVHPDDLADIAATVHEPGEFKIEYRIYNRKGQVRWLLGYGTHVENSQTEQNWIDGFIMDITERKEMEQSLLIAKDKAEQAASARAAFLANMSHEIRTPMNAVIGFSDILLDDVVETEHRKYITTINQSAKSLLHLLNDILDSAKLDKGKFQLEMRDFSLIEEIDAVVSTLWLQAKNKDLYLNVKVAPLEGHLFNGAPDRIRQVLTNLIGNAIKFTETGGVNIDVGVKPSGCIAFSIIDTGIGMTQEQLGLVFDAFGQADASMSRRFGGTGLGTTISKQLVELMGGKITATSTYAQGSCFSFTLPLAPPKGETLPEVLHRRCTLPSLHILIVDDIQQNIDLLTLLMTRQGHNVSTARDGKQALLRMRSDKFDVVLMDIQMPVMDGLTSSKERRVEEHTQQLVHLPIIALSASVLAEDRQAAFDAGMDGFANKPVDVELLNVEIALALGIDLTCEVITIAPNDNSDSHIVDETKGISMWGDKNVLYKEISRFIDQNEGIILGLHDTLNLPDWQAIRLQLHTLKGLSGNLALTQLSQLFNDAEHPATRSSVKEIATVFGAIEQAFSVVKDYLLTLNVDVPVPEDKSQDKDMLISPLLDVVDILSKSAQNNEYNEEAAELLVARASNVFLDKCRRIQNALDDFEFELAARELEQLKAQITRC